ncbi:hypothetical protein N7468_004054 [Penicillium chermesinum]|uniref:Uncharacterized protein n=1 Tax=Penicillium chermesinum TaxID=63820 RepID=A0A9W9P7S0_9EURO|nr:uncharacterized protein N7468_004054 [Penicillium chermesinum]KAJ5239435.1 hypothetical protein N7468_004054 [Penicillium chermesinum]
MASFKELSLSRPLPNPSQRQHSHSISLGAVNANHRVTRRKSVTTSVANAAAAIAATMKDGDSASLPASHRRSLGGRKGLESSSLGATAGFSSYLSRSVNSPSQEPPIPRKASPSNSDSADGKASNGRNRRASEGAQSKTDGKRIPADLRCDRCGKGMGYYLETPYLQAPAGSAPRGCYSAGHDEPGRPGTLAGSRFRSFLPSPDASSEVHDGLSSAETTPPPMDEQDEDDDFEMSGVPTNWTKRPSISNASAFSRSYQSIPSSSYNDSAPLHSPTFSHFRQSSVDTRPSTADTKLHEDDEADLAAAIGLCNFGTPRTVPVSVTPDVPPVPPLPARYLDAGSHPGNRSASFAHSGPQSEAFRRGSNADMFLSPSSLNPSLSYKVSDMRGAPTGEAEARNGRQRRNADVDFGSRTGPVDDDDDGVFGRMEE